MNTLVSGTADTEHESAGSESAGHKSAAISLRAPAKINLHLGIYPGRDERGYHKVDTLMVAVDVGDCVELFDCMSAHECTSAEGTDELDGISLEMRCAPGVAMESLPLKRNTAWLAATRLCSALGVPAHYHIVIKKNVPPQSGLGAASSDAAAVLKGLSRLHGVSSNDARVLEVAQSIGADVAFFLHPLPSYLDGVGDCLRETYTELGTLPLVLVRPHKGVSTVEAYKEFDHAALFPHDATSIRRAAQTGDHALLVSSLYNNLETAAFHLVPECRTIKDWLSEQSGVCAAQVSGSGSCVFALCDSWDSAQAIARRASENHAWWVRATKTLGLHS